MPDIARSIGEHAYSLGFDALGIVPAVHPQAEQLAAAMRWRINKGIYPPFAESSIERRIHLQHVLPHVRSIIVGAVGYYSGDPPPIVPGHGRLARYCWGQDYHHVLRRRLDMLAAGVQKIVGADVSVVSQVDATPIAEKAAAVQARIGAIGRNSLLYVPRLGSWVFLGEVLTSAVLPEGPVVLPDRPAAVSCHGCGRCVQACPTGALSSSYGLNPFRCLAYICQMPGLIPQQFRHFLGSRVWGCDTCQEVCPRNRGAGRCRHPEFAAASDQSTGGDTAGTLDLINLLNQTSSAFRHSYSARAFSWRGRRTMLRNALIVLGNQAYPEFVPVIASLADHASPILRAAAAWALTNITSKKARSVLHRMALNESDERVCQELQLADTHPK